MNFDAWRHYLRGRLFRLLRQPDRAVTEYEAALALEPDSVRLTHVLAFMHNERGDYTNAERLFRRVTQLAPDSVSAWYNLGFLYERQQEPAKAIEPLRRAVELDRKLDRAWYGLGLAYAALHRHEEAAKAFEEAATLQPMNPHAWYQYGMAYHQLHNPDKVKEITLHLHRFDPRMARELIRDAERSDLAHLVADLRV